MARRKTTPKPNAPTTPVKNAGRQRIQVMNGRGGKRMFWRDEFEAKQNG